MARRDRLHRWAGGGETPSRVIRYDVPSLGSLRPGCRRGSLGSRVRRSTFAGNSPREIIRIMANPQAHLARGVAEPDGRRLGGQRPPDPRGHRRGPGRGRPAAAACRRCASPATAWATASCAPARWSARWDRAGRPGRRHRRDRRGRRPAGALRGGHLQRDGPAGRRRARRPGRQGEPGHRRRRVREPLLQPLAPRPPRRVPRPRRHRPPRSAPRCSTCRASASSPSRSARTPGRASVPGRPTPWPAPRS